ncbi:hypothetical protein [Streptomyces sp. SID8352]|uniref:hypothetical protein n=1 Tax=Streptomyces sp. SID8352 TaxID=2690338 RepID=UPI001925C880|nr:hypothetical protein [Streptomyces sp. SID8352]
MDSQRAAVLAHRQPARIRALEQQAIADATRPLAQALATAHKAALTRWTRETSGQQIPARLDDLIAWLRKTLREAFAGRGRQAQRAATQAAFAAALDAALRTAQLAAGMRGKPAPPVSPAIGTDAQATADAIPAAVEEEHGHALALLTTASLTAMGLAGLNAVFSRARRAIGRIARGVAVAIGHAATHAAQLVARALGSDTRLLWVTEPDACAACRAYAGRHIRPGGRFPGGLSLDPQRTSFPTAIPGPPRHPHCRCALVPWSPTWRVSGPPLPTLLRQQARITRRP